MKLRNVLFSLSLLFLISCEGNSNDRVAKLEVKLDSLSNTHQANVDSLNRIIADYQSQISELKMQESALRDSITELGVQHKKPRIYPDPKPSGLPTRDIRKPGDR